MSTGLTAVVAAVVMSVLWLSLDSGILEPERAPAAMSGALLALGILFGVGAWGFAAGGRGERSPALTGLGLGVMLYAGIRLLLP
jgi:hypothetical protein